MLIGRTMLVQLAALNSHATWRPVMCDRSVRQWPPAKMGAVWDTASPHLLCRGTFCSHALRLGSMGTTVMGVLGAMLWTLRGRTSWTVQLQGR